MEWKLHLGRTQNFDGSYIVAQNASEAKDLVNRFGKPAHLEIADPSDSKSLVEYLYARYNYTSPPSYHFQNNAVLPETEQMLKSWSEEASLMDSSDFDELDDYEDEFDCE